MFESEANLIEESLLTLPADILARFAEARSLVARRSVIPWSEHCTECVWPTCYTTCEMYQPRTDGRCRRFVDGMVRIPCESSLNGYLLRITFKPWAKLWAPGNTRLLSLADADRAEKSDARMARLIQVVPLANARGLASRKRYSWKKRAAQQPADHSYSPDCLLIECVNPNDRPLSVTLVIRGVNRQVPHQSLLTMQPGFNRHRVPAADIALCVDLHAPFDIELTPNLDSEPRTLIFGALDFVVEAQVAQQVVHAPTKTQTAQRICKCVVWDLDHTLWDGILTEDGLDRLRLKPQMTEILHDLDQRGILLSVVSKNNAEEAIAALEHFGVADLFLHPQISWNPKSTGIHAIASKLNIGLDSILFLDDSPFERGEVQSACSGVTILDAAEYLTLPSRADCQAPVTDESRKRRLLYRDQQSRETAQTRFSGDYVAFLHDCRLRLVLHTLQESNLARVHELTQRTNQMNFSGNRYTLAQLREIMNDAGVDTYVLDCEDRFGSYGTIGFCTVLISEHRMTDLMFSCRIQSKRVEHAFLTCLLRRYREANPVADFLVDYRQTERNQASGGVFTDFGFEVIGEQDGVHHLLFPASRTIPDDAIVEVVSLAQPVRPVETASVSQ